MCGRFTLHATPTEIAEFFDLFADGRDSDPFDGAPPPPRYNIAPTQPILAVRQQKESKDRELQLLVWGLVPSWAKDTSMMSRMINARSETVGEKPGYRSAFKRRRCLIPVSGFYEWSKVTPQKKQPYLISSNDGGLLALAGLWEYWESDDGSVIESCTILTTEANDLLGEIHQRMPVIVRPNNFELWLDPTLEDRDELPSLQRLFKPHPASDLQMYPVSTYVNNARHEGPECIEPVGEQRELFE